MTDPLERPRTIDPNTWDRLEEIFFHALELDPADRPAYLDEACGADAALRREVDAVLAGHLAAGGTANSDRLLSPTAVDGVGTLPAGARIGTYAIDSVIGRGGMGEVYRARRADAQYEQQVAIKLMRPGRNTEDLLRRFKTERQILARLQHPNIATLLDGGVTEQGQPYLVMQYVAGAALTTYANDRNLDLAQRLRLFLTVCETVQFAHANLVVHRDLKPSNILVTAEGDVRLLDFGIAKLLDPAVDGSTTGDLLLLTPEHAAPEQFLGATVTTATDVYALGVLLYELLTGSRPFQFVPPLELHRAVCEQDSRAPSAAAADASWLSRAKLARSPVVADRIVGDLDAIVLKALRKDPARRYASAAEMAEDVRRHLNGFPVLARPETVGYVVGRWIRRHRVGVAAGIGLAAALVALVAVSVRSAVVSRAQARAIAEERDVAVQVSSFLETLFRSPQPFAAGPSRRDTMRIRDFLAEGATKVRTELTGTPRVQARLLTVLGNAYTDLGALDLAAPLLEEAATIHRREHGPAAVPTAIAERSLAGTLWQLGKVARAESLFRRAAATLEADSATSRDDWIKALGGLGNTLMTQARFAEAESTYRRALQATAGDSNSTERASRSSDLASALDGLGRVAEAESLMRRAVDLERAANGPDHPRVATPLGNLGVQLMRQNRFAEAEPLLREALAIQLARLPNPHPRTSSTLSNLGAALLRQRKLAPAESLLRQAVTMQRALYGNVHPTLGGTILNLAAVLDEAGQTAEAGDLKAEAKSVLIAALGPEHPTVANAHQNIGVSLHRAGRHREALAEFEAAVAIRKKKLPPGDPNTASSLAALGGTLLDLGRHREAEAAIQEAYRRYEPIREREARQWKNVLGLLARLYRATGRPAEAAAMAARADSVAAPEKR